MTPLNRREFITATALGLAAGGCGVQTPKSAAIPGKIMGASMAAGHRLRLPGGLRPPTQKRKTKVLILGGGIAGLSAGRYLAKAGFHDFEILELESKPGGNSSFYDNKVCPSPWGAHYVPIPNPQCRPIIELFQELKVIESFSPAALPIYNEFYLCSEPMERLFFHGQWQEGLVPHHGLTADEKRRFSEFVGEMDRFKKRVGADGKPAFTIPLDSSSQDADLLALDRISMAQYLADKKWSAAPLRWYVEYCCRDDYGSTLEHTSAWAGIHYFACRQGVAHNAASHAVLTWPEGNGWLVKQMAGPLQPNIRTGFLVASIQPLANGALVDVIDLATDETIRYETDQVICALPRFVARHLIKSDTQDFAKSCTYSPWAIATLFLNAEVPGMSNSELAWDNVFYGSSSLGYVVANHQLPEVVHKDLVLTYYFPLTEKAPAEERNLAMNRTHAQWCDLIVADLERVHPGIRKAISQIDLWIWGHAMIRPVPGFIWGETRKQMASSLGNIHFAHSDMSGVSIFEEAFIRGQIAAGKTLEALKV